MIVHTLSFTVQMCLPMAGMCSSLRVTLMFIVESGNYPSLFICAILKPCLWYVCIKCLSAGQLSMLFHLHVQGCLWHVICHPWSWYSLGLHLFLNI